LTAPPSRTSFSKSANASAVQSAGENIDEVSIAVFSGYEENGIVSKLRTPKKNLIRKAGKQEISDVAAKPIRN